MAMIWLWYNSILKVIVMHTQSMYKMHVWRSYIHVHAELWYCVMHLKDNGVLIVLQDNYFGVTFY